ncbi:outer membrane protein assembly factor BamE domain-containing protein [Achromobacter xylosoxidans]
MNLRLSAVLVSTLLLAGCATGGDVAKIKPGMTKEQVTAIVGAPDGFQQRDGYEVLQYTNRLMSNWSWDRTDYTVLLKDDRVVEYGTGVVRERTPNSGTLVIVPVK